MCNVVYEKKRGGGFKRKRGAGGGGRQKGERERANTLTAIGSCFVRIILKTRLE